MNDRRSEGDHQRRRELHNTEDRQPPDVGTLWFDTELDKVGEFRGSVGTKWQLRPPGGGLEWEASPGKVEPAGTYEHLRALAAEKNTTRRAHRL